MPQLERAPREPDSTVLTREAVPVNGSGIGVFVMDARAVQPSEVIRSDKAEGPAPRTPDQSL